MADGFDTIPCEPNQSDCQKGSQYTFDTQVGSAYNVSRAIAEQWQVIDKLKQDVDAVADKTAVKDYNGNIFENLTLTGENGVNVDISEDDPEQLVISLDQDITNQIEINMENIILLENNTDSLDERVTQTETSITELAPDVARALKTPMVTPTETKLVAVDTTNSQEMIGVDNTLKIENNTLKLNVPYIIDYKSGNNLTVTDVGTSYGWYKLYSNGMIEYGGTTNANSNSPAGTNVFIHPPFNNVVTQTFLTTALGAKDRCITCVPSTFPTTPGFKIEVSRVNSTNTAETGTYFAYYATGYLSE